MATLADLFVSYKSVQPEPTQDPDRIDRLANLLVARSRLQQIEESQSTNDGEEEPLENPDEGTTEELPEGVPFLSNPGDFQWFTRPIIPKPVGQPVEEMTATPYRAGFIPRGTVTKYNRGQLDKEIKALFDSAGINIKVTSGKRKAGAVGNAGARSHHVGGNAVDIVPGNGETFESIKRKMTQHPEILQFFYENGLGVIDETTAATMKKTGATGKHFHIGPDQWALRTWSNWTGTYRPVDSRKPATQQEWARNVHSAFVKGLKDEYGSKYTNDTYNRIATYMTYQAALESGYGEHANGFNYSGHMRNGKTIHYSTMNEFVKAHIKTLKKWDIMKANSLQEYVNSLYQGKYKYNAHDPASTYYAAINGTSSRVNRYLGLMAKFGGKFQSIRQLHEQSFGEYR